MLFAALFAIATGLFALLFQTVPDGLTPIDPSAPIDPTVLLHDAMVIYKDWRSGGVVVALSLVVWLATQVSKNTVLLEKIPTYWRPYIALVLGVASGSLAALSSGAHFWPGAVFAGVAAGLGSIAFDQLLTQWKIRAFAVQEKKDVANAIKYAPPASTTTKAVAILLIGALALPAASCAFMQKVAADVDSIDSVFAAAFKACPDCDAFTVSTAWQADVAFVTTVIAGIKNLDPLQILNAYLAAKGTHVVTCQYSVALYLWNHRANLLDGGIPADAGAAVAVADAGTPDAGSATIAVRRPGAKSAATPTLAAQAKAADKSVNALNDALLLNPNPDASQSLLREVAFRQGVYLTAPRK